METKMKAAVVTEFGRPLDIREIPVPRIGPGQVLVRVRASGVCHTDLHAAEGDWPVKPHVPFVPGHEGVGEVAEIGAGVTHLKEGDRVGVPWLHTACGRCEHCVGGWETLCDTQQNTGYSVDGAYADYVAADANFVGVIPAGLDWGPASPVLCAGVTVYKGLKETEVRPGQWVAISGIGGLGHMAVQYAKAMGMNVVAVDVADDKLDLARALGADEVINAKEVDPAKEVSSNLGGVHGALVTAPSRPAFAQAVGMLRKHGTLSLVGIPPGDFPLPIFEVVLKRLTVRGSIVGTRLDLAESLALAAEGKVETEFAWDELDNINAIFDRMREGKIEGRVVLRM
ncbi:alcohol dehydrogenase AdhP [uncultured Jannaschia sp.]|uniref:alcohol dehydrogenase AdhP n=1 Tax=uncultured Jannaschia sp. TaxID=293347 RepID=UPI002614F83F|nr:alcohol dehydrogenase AdhP [uncultured Jannaschia sp.]